MNNSFDDKIRKLAKEKNEIPLEFENTIKDALTYINNLDVNKNNNKNKSHKWNFRIVSSIAACFVFLCTTVFANTASEISYNIYKRISNQKITVTVPEEVVQDKKIQGNSLDNKNIIMKWNPDTNNKLDLDNLDINFYDIEFENYEISFKYSLKIPDEITQYLPKENVYSIRFPDLLIKDENDNILFCLDENKLKEIFNYKSEDELFANNKYCISKIKNYGAEINYEAPNSDIFTGYMTIYTCLPSLYPESKQLSFEFNSIALDEKNACIGIGSKPYLHQDQTLTIIGNKKVTVDVPKKYAERNKNNNFIYYKLSENDTNIDDKLLYCYYDRSKQLMYCNVNLKSVDISGPWQDVKLSDYLEQFEIDSTLKQYIINKARTSKEFKEYEIFTNNARKMQDIYVEASNGHRSIPSGLCTLNNGKMEDFSKSSDGYSSYIDNSRFIQDSPDALDIAEEYLTDTMKLKIKYLDRDIVFEIEKYEEVK